METSERRQVAIERKHAGYNCCQAVLCAFSDLTPYTEEQLCAIGAAFGVGMGGMEATCGALLGAGVLLGIVRDGEPVMRDARTLRRVALQGPERTRYRQGALPLRRLRTRCG